MAEPTRYMFTHKEVVAALLRQQGIHEGIWRLSVKFGLGASSMGSGPADRLPTAIIPILEMGVEKSDELDNVSVDAADVNPAPSRPSRRKTAKRR